MTIKQIRVGFDNFCYIIFCPKKKKAAVVDPGYNFSNLIELISNNNWTLEYIIATHYHMDHLIGTSLFDVSTQIMTSDRTLKNIQTEGRNRI